MQITIIPTKAFFSSTGSLPPSKNSITGPSKRPPQSLLANWPPPVDRALGEFTLAGFSLCQDILIERGQGHFRGEKKSTFLKFQNHPNIKHKESTDKSCTKTLQCYLPIKNKLISLKRTKTLLLVSENLINSGKKIQLRGRLQLQAWIKKKNIQIQI